VGLTLAHQHLAQLDEDVCAEVLANAGTRVAFRVVAQDALPLAREMQPKFEVFDLGTSINSLI